MRTTATNRKIRTLITDLADEKLIPNPTFQRRLVWTSAHKYRFLETILLGYPFPEIYIAASQVDPQTAKGTEMLVDGQQRLTTIFQYFRGDCDIDYTLEVPPYNALQAEFQHSFLEYEVVVRDLGQVGIDKIKEVFQRINSTKYSLNAMEIQNARYEGAFKEFGDSFAQDSFFERHGVFNTSDIRRMGDTRFALMFISTLLTGYFNRDVVLEEFLSTYNDEFPHAAEISKRVQDVLGFLEECNFAPNSRIWNKADLFTIMVELDAVFREGKVTLQVEKVSGVISEFLSAVDSDVARERGEIVATYYKAAVQATNDRSNRLIRGEIIRHLLCN